MSSGNTTSGSAQGFRPACLRPRAQTILLLLCALLAAGCSTFNRDWKRAASQPSAEALGGRWEGTWRSERNGHHGGLRALARPLDAGHYEFRFRASYWKILRFGYTAELAVAPADGSANTFEGEADLGIWGVFQFQGQATPHQFRSQYETSHDHGVFEMQRPANPNP